jgi:hypothetical protein
MAVRPDLDDAALRGYLLGLLPEAEAEALEEAYFARPDVLERVRGVENDLLDDYASGRLEPGEKGAFESRYLGSAPLRERVVAARALRLATADKRGPAARLVARPVRWRFPLAIAAGLLLAVLALWIRPPRPPQVTSASLPPDSAGPSETQQPQSAASVGPSRAPTPTTPVRQPATSRLVLALSPVLLRGQERPAQLRIPDGTDMVVLELEGDPALVPPSVSALEAVVKTVEGEPVWRGEARRVTDARRPSLLASAGVPAERLGPGDYLLTLSVRGTADGTLYSYFFRVGR